MNDISLNNSLKEFEDLHNEAQSLISKGNFSFGTGFHDSEKNIKNNFDAEGKDSFDFDFGNDKSPQDNIYDYKHQNRAPQTAPGRVRKQWGKKTDPETNLSPEFNEPRNQRIDNNYSQNSNYYAPQQELRHAPVQNFSNDEDEYRNDKIDDCEDNYDEEFENYEEDEDEEAQNIPIQKQNLVMDINFESSQDMKKIEARKQIMLKRREEQEQKRREKLISKNRKAEKKSVKPSSVKYDQNVPQSAKIVKTQKGGDVLNSEYSRLNSEVIGSAKAKSDKKMIESPINELKRKIRRNNLMNVENEENKVGLTGKAKSSLLTKENEFSDKNL